MYFFELLFFPQRREKHFFIFYEIPFGFLIFVFWFCFSSVTPPLSVEAGGVQWIWEREGRLKFNVVKHLDLSTYHVRYQLLALKLKVKKRKAQKLKNKIKFWKTIDIFWNTENKNLPQRDPQATKNWRKPEILPVKIAQRFIQVSSLHFYGFGIFHPSFG